jgi:hypothetical protein
MAAKANYLQFTEKRFNSIYFTLKSINYRVDMHSTVAKLLLVLRGDSDVALFHYPSCTDPIKPSL